MIILCLGSVSFFNFFYVSNSLSLGYITLNLSLTVIVTCSRQVADNYSKVERVYPKIRQSQIIAAS